MKKSMEAKPDISNAEDIKLLVDSFYSLVKKDDLLGDIFSRAIGNWDTHLPKMYRFWESVLFDKKSYRGNPMLVHIALNKSYPLNKVHFERWMELWTETVGSLFVGFHADLALQRAGLMAKLMQFKIAQSAKPGFVQ